MLTDGQLIELAKRMDIPLERVCFKDELKDQPLKYNVGYIINLENVLDENGDQNEGSHWTVFTVRKYENDKIEPIYFNSYGKPPPEEVKLFVEKHERYSINGRKCLRILLFSVFILDLFV